MSRLNRDTNLPTGLSPEYWSTWTPSRKGASVSESIDRDTGEEWIGGWDGIGLYEGNNKVPSYQVLSVHLTNQRLILIPEDPSSSSSSSSTSQSASLQTNLSYVRQTEFYAGFMRSSAKITLTLGPQPPSSSNNATPTSASTSNSNSNAEHGTNENTASNNGWTCNICGYVNALNPNRVSPIPTPESKCGLCGIPYSTSKLSVSAAPSRTSTPIPKTQSAVNSNITSDSDNAGTTQTSNDGLISCPACTFLNSPLLPNCEICSTALPRKMKSSNPSSTAAVNGTSGRATDKADIVRLSFRKGGEKEVYKRLKAVLSDKAWERGVNGSASSKAKVANGGNIEGLPRSGAGIDGILQQIDLNSKSQSNHISEAFADLEVLMLRAGEMVKLAQSINTKLTNQLNNSSTTSSGAASQPQPTEEETTMIRSSLVQLGLAAPAITKEMIKDENKYHNSLAKELGELLTGRKDQNKSKHGLGLMVGQRGRGVIALDEVWGLWMRARGVSLLPPSTLISILHLIPNYTSPSITCLTLPSSLQVLHTPNYSINSILLRTLERLNPTSSSNVPSSEDGTSEFDQVGGAGVEKSFTLLEFSSFENLPIGLTKEFIEILEKTSSGLVRDDQSNLTQGGVRWYRDIISDWPVENI